VPCWSFVETPPGPGGFARPARRRGWRSPGCILSREHQSFARAGFAADAAAQFIDHGADLHARDEDICSTPLGWAAKFGQLPMVQLLLERGAKPNLPDDPPWATPLAWATRRGHTEIAELLARHGLR
jgi:hypothetical protein